MKLICQSPLLTDYLPASAIIDYEHETIQALASQLYSRSASDTAYMQAAFEFVRDRISHSWDIQSSRITCKASDVLYYREGICYAKSNLLCALLRARGIPAGFSYQRLTLGDTPDTGYCIHALNAVYIAALERWVRVDARGNKPGVDAQFSLGKEQLAFPVRAHYEEIDYPIIYTDPHPATVAVLQQHTDCNVMYRRGLPDAL